VKNLQAKVEKLCALPPSAALTKGSYAVLNAFLDALEDGDLRAAVRDQGVWRAVPWVKQGILMGFRIGRIADMSVPAKGKGHQLSFVDKHTFPTRPFGPKSGVRIVPGGSSIRRGAYIAKGVVCMPPMFVNVGAYVGEKTMIDSHALVGSCAQIGARVHISAAAQIGGVLEPVNASPVVIEDDALVGGNCGIYEGTVVRTRAVIGAGVVLTRGTPVYDLVRERVIKGTPERALEIPEDAVVVPGARTVSSGWGKEHGLSLQTPVIVKYRDAKTDTATALEAWLR
jgi:2,3,4,5-tetrahydropyridine-2-carboxylate N-succinyltransferase